MWAYELGVTRECEGRPMVWEIRQVREDVTGSLRLIRGQLLMTALL